jgi:hypothetical protein
MSIEHRGGFTHKFKKALGVLGVLAATELGVSVVSDEEKKAIATTEKADPPKLDREMEKQQNVGVRRQKDDADAAVLRMKIASGVFDAKKTQDTLINRTPQEGSDGVADKYKLPIDSGITYEEDLEDGIIIARAPLTKDYVFIPIADIHDFQKELTTPENENFVQEIIAENFVHSTIDRSNPWFYRVTGPEGESVYVRPEPDGSLTVSLSTSRDVDKGINVEKGGLVGAIKKKIGEVMDQTETKI